VRSAGSRVEWIAGSSIPRRDARPKRLTTHTSACWGTGSPTRGGRRAPRAAEGEPHARRKESPRRGGRAARGLAQRMAARLLPVRVPLRLELHVLQEANEPWLGGSGRGFRRRMERRDVPRDERTDARSPVGTSVVTRADGRTGDGRTGGTARSAPVRCEGGRRQRRSSPPRPPRFFSAGAAAAAAPSDPNASDASRFSRSAAADRGAPLTTGTPSLTALR